MFTNDEQAIVPIWADVVPSHPGDAWPDAVRDELYACYKLTRGAARARRWYLRQVGEDTPVPAESTIKRWIRFYAWDERAESEYRLEYGHLIYETERQS